MVVQNGLVSEVECNIAIDFSKDYTQAKEPIAYTELEEEFGEELLRPLKGRCFPWRTGIWQYNFCIGKSVEQLHIEEDGSISERFLLGTQNSTN